LNYRLTLRVTIDAHEKEAEAVVWWQAWRKPDPYQLKSWMWGKNEQQNKRHAGD